MKSRWFAGLLLAAFLAGTLVGSMGCNSGSSGPVAPSVATDSSAASTAPPPASGNANNTKKSTLQD